MYLKRCSKIYQPAQINIGRKIEFRYPGRKLELGFKVKWRLNKLINFNILTSLMLALMRSFGLSGKKKPFALSSGTAFPTPLFTKAQLLFGFNAAAASAYADPACKGSPVSRSAGSTTLSSDSIFLGSPSDFVVSKVAPSSFEVTLSSPLSCACASAPPQGIRTSA